MATLNDWKTRVINSNKVNFDFDFDNFMKDIEPILDSSKIKETQIESDFLDSKYGDIQANYSPKNAIPAQTKSIESNVDSADYGQQNNDFKFTSFEDEDKENKAKMLAGYINNLKGRVNIQKAIRYFNLNWDTEKSMRKKDWNNRRTLALNTFNSRNEIQDLKNLLSELLLKYNLIQNPKIENQAPIDYWDARAKLIMKIEDATKNTALNFLKAVNLNSKGAINLEEDGKMGPQTTKAWEEFGDMYLKNNWDDANFSLWNAVPAKAGNNNQGKVVRNNSGSFTNVDTLVSNSNENVLISKPFDYKQINIDNMDDTYYSLSSYEKDAKNAFINWYIENNHNFDPKTLTFDFNNSSDYLTFKKYLDSLYSDGGGLFNPIERLGKFNMDEIRNLPDYLKTAANKLLTSGKKASNRLIKENYHYLYYTNPEAYQMQYNPNIYATPEFNAFRNYIIWKLNS